jgi:hypothetical protein
MLRLRRMLLIAQPGNRLRRGEPARPRQDVRHGDAEEAHVLARRQGAPAGVLVIPQCRGYVGRERQVGEGVDAEKRGRRGQHHRHERRRGDRGERRKHRDVVHRSPRRQAARQWLVAQFVVDHQQPERFTAGAAELVLIDQPEQRRLVELAGSGGVAVELLPRRRQQPRLQPRVRVEAGDHPGQAAPGSLQPLEARIMQHGVELRPDQRVDGGDVAIDQPAQPFGVGAQGHRQAVAEPDGERALILGKKGLGPRRYRLGARPGKAARQDFVPQWRRDREVRRNG